MAGGNRPGVDRGLHGLCGHSGGRGMSQKIKALRAVVGPAATAATITLGSLLLVAAIPSIAATPDEQIRVVVDGEPITEGEVERRLKFDRLATHREPSRQQVVEELIAEKLKLREARRSGIDVADPDVENAYANMAKRMNLTPDRLTGALAHAGVDAATLKQRIRADIAWQQYVRKSRGLYDDPSPRK